MNKKGTYLGTTSFSLLHLAHEDNGSHRSAAGCFVYRLPKNSKAYLQVNMT